MQSTEGLLIDGEDSSPELHLYTVRSIDPPSYFGRSLSLAASHSTSTI